MATATVSDQPDPKRSWADEACEPPEEPEVAPPSTSDDAVTSDLKIDSLAINDALTDPDDASIQAVTSGDTLYKSAKTFQELNLSEDKSAKTFQELNLSEDLLKDLYAEVKFERPRKIQVVSLPMILTPPYKNLIAQAHNGSGKTTPPPLS